MTLGTDTKFAWSKVERSKVESPEKFSGRKSPLSDCNLRVLKR